VTGQLAGAARLVVDAMHVMAVSQLSHADPVRDHEERKGGEGKTQKEAVRASSASDLRHGITGADSSCALREVAIGP